LFIQFIELFLCRDIVFEQEGEQEHEPHFEVLRPDGVGRCPCGKIDQVRYCAASGYGHCFKSRCSHSFNFPPKSLFLLMLSLIDVIIIKQQAKQ